MTTQEKLAILAHIREQIERVKASEGGLFAFKASNLIDSLGDLKDYIIRKSLETK